MENTEKTGLFHRGAHDGLPFGIYLSVLFLCVVYSVQINVLSLLAIAMMVGVPVVTYLRLRNAYVASQGTATFSELWMQGIVMFGCGSLLMALTGFVFLRYLQPDFVTNLMAQVKQTLADPSMSSVAKAYEGIDFDSVAQVITPVNFSLELVWNSMFSGSILSLLVALIVPLRKVKS